MESINNVQQLYELQYVSIDSTYYFNNRTNHYSMVRGNFVVENKTKNIYRSSMLELLIFLINPDTSVSRFSF